MVTAMGMMILIAEENEGDGHGERGRREMEGPARDGGIHEASVQMTKQQGKGSGLGGT